MADSPVQELLARAREVVLKSIACPDIEGYLCAAVLRQERPTWAKEAVAALCAVPAPALARSTDVAIVGLRNALAVSPDDLRALGVAVVRELSRQPLPPVRRAHDDERLMLGIAAAVAAVPEHLGAMSAAFRGVEGKSPRWSAVVSGALRLAGMVESEMIEAAARVVTDHGDQSVTFKDAVALLWLAAEVMDMTAWKPDDAALAAFDVALRRYYRTIVMDAPRVLDSIDAAMLLRGLAARPSERLARRSITEAVVAVVESFSAVAELLAKRPRHRKGIAIQDEYDVQWLVHALLVPIVPDLVPEDPAPKLAGRSSRLDFTSKSAKLGIETKVISSLRDLPRRRQELMVDERQYQEHPYVETVVAFVCDLGRHVPLADRPAFERDLSGPLTVGGRSVEYIVRLR